ncbi:MAG: hypothetical protein AVDCRST_MAG32-1202, partial [uncultured Nocardioides sp.]
CAPATRSGLRSPAPTTAVDPPRSTCASCASRPTGPGSRTWNPRRQSG